MTRQDRTSDHRVLHLAFVGLRAPLLKALKAGKDSPQHQRQDQHHRDAARGHLRLASKISDLRLRVPRSPRLSGEVRPGPVSMSK